MKYAGTGTDLGPREATNQMKRDSEESSKENSGDSKIIVKLGGKDMMVAHIKKSEE